MKIKPKLISVLLGALLFTFLFYKQDLGLNLFLFEIIVFFYFVFKKKISFHNIYLKTINVGFLLSAIFTVINFSVYTYFVNIVFFGLFVGCIIYPKVQLLANSFFISILSLFESQGSFVKELFDLRLKDRHVGKFIWKARIFILPIIIVFAFIGIYSASNPKFSGLVGNLEKYLNSHFFYLFEGINLLIVFVFILGLIICNYIIYHTSSKIVQKEDQNGTDELRREKKLFKAFKIFSLLNEYRAAIFLFILLNALLLIVNIIDINWVWFGFEWEGQYLKQFVHEGTYLLIFSIIISIALVLYFFRANLNFYSKNKLLKVLSFIWLIQNGILTISVAIRNLYYIENFALAYKRIGVILFLILVLYGLYTVFIKVYKIKSSFYLLRKNSYALILILLLSSFVNWDSIIANYNFKNSSKSFLHLDFMSELSSKTLYLIDKPIEELNEIQKLQDDKFNYEVDYMTPGEYYDKIQMRKSIFIQDWQSKGFLSWNYAEYLCFKKLNK